MRTTFTPEQASLLDRGWPHLRIVTDAKVKDPAKAAGKQLAAGDPILDVEWPRAVAHRYLWASLHPRHSPEAKKALARSSPFDEANVPELLDRLFPSMDSYAFHAEDVFYLLEALFGTAKTAQWMIERLERLKAWKQGTSNPHDRLFVALEALGWILHRLGREKPELRARLVKIRKPRGKTCAGRYLDVVLDGARGFARVESRHITTECCFLAGRMPALSRDAKTIARLIDHIDPWGDPQYAWIAGVKILRETELGRRMPPERKREVRKHFAVFRDPVVARAVASL
jgi:hypothetical protein